MPFCIQKILVCKRSDLKKHFSDVPSGRLKEPSKLEFVKFSWFLGGSRRRISILRIALSPFRMRKLHISGSLFIFIVRLLGDHFSHILVVIFIRMKVSFVSSNLHEIELYPDKLWYVLIKSSHTFAITHTSYNTSVCKENNKTKFKCVQLKMTSTFELN